MFIRRKFFASLSAAGTLLVLLMRIPASAQSLPADHAQRMTRGLEMFRTDIAPLLKEHCVKCHGGEKTKSDFDLVTRDGLLRGGAEGLAVKPFSAAESPLMKLIRHEAEPHMPSKQPKLPEDTIARIAAWIDHGAPYEAPLLAGKANARDKAVVTEEDRKWWAFQPLGKVTPPARGHPVDAFLSAKGAEKKLKLAPPADQRTLLRRATLDLTGLPPTPEEVDAFLADQSARAWEKVINRLLDSPRHGERWARHWLDVARFAESSGFEHDYDRPNAFHYRDFVIKALNSDLPFDQFARWQIAGDEIDPDNPLAMMATGFLGAGVFPTQITANEVERTRYDALDDMLATTGSAFLGLSIGCARCHDHKFDPIPTKDYYRMLSTFTSTVRSDVELELEPEKAKREKAEHAAKAKELLSALTVYENDDLKPRFEKWLGSDEASLSRSMWQWLEVTNITSKGGATFTNLGDGSWLASGKNPAEDTYTLTASTTTRRITGLKLEALTHSSLPSKGPGRAANGNIALSKTTVSATPLSGGTAREVKLAKAEATHEQNKAGLSAASSLDDDPKTGWAVDAGGIGKDQAAAFTFAEPLDLEGGATLTVKLDFRVNTAHCIGRPRLSLCTDAVPTVKGDALPAAVAALEEKVRTHAMVNDKERTTLFDWWKQRDAGWRDRNERVAAHAKKAPKTTTTVMICGEGYKPIVMHSQGAPFLKETHLLRRGDANQKQAVAEPGFLQVLSGDANPARWKWEPPAEAKFSGRRRTFANWLTDTERGAGTLMARVTVNRLWQHHFGRGLVATPNDFGHSGALPSHPELLDYLAGELIRNGWKLKPMHRLIMTSAAYRQSSATDARKSAADPDNTLFLRRTPRRLEGEAVRDSILAVSGLLDPTMYGRGTLDENSKRRSIYFTVKRSQLVNSMVVFDAPEPLTSQGSRPSTTVAPQALLLMNSPQVRAWAKAFAQRLEKETKVKNPDDLTPLIQRAYALALSRPPRADELRAATNFIRHGLAAGRAQAFTDFCQTLLALNEFAYEN
jgi:mono/diheme cytochrome c family protein